MADVGRPGAFGGLRGSFTNRRNRAVERRSENLVLRALRAKDLDDFVAGIDDEVMRWQGFTPMSVEAFRSGFADYVNRSYYGWPCGLAIAARDTDNFLGSYQLERVSAVSAHLGWWLSDQARGRGLGTESLGLALEYAHSDVRIRRITMGTTVDNIRAIAQIERTGAVLQQQGPHTLPNGDTVEALWYQHAPG